MALSEIINKGNRDCLNPNQTETGLDNLFLPVFLAATDQLPKQLLQKEKIEDWLIAIENCWAIHLATFTSHKELRSRKQVAELRSQRKLFP